MSIAAHDSSSIQPMSPVFLRPIGQAGTPLPNLDIPSKSGSNDVGDHTEEEPHLDGFKSPLLQPNKRRKAAQSSPAISGEISLSSDVQASLSFKRLRTLEPASFTGSDVPRSDSLRDGASSLKHADLSFSNAGPPKLPHIIPLTNHGAAPSLVMPNSRHAAYTPKPPAEARQDQRTIHSQSLLGKSDSSENSRQHESRSLESASTTTSLSPDPSASRPEPNPRPIGGHSTRASTQFMTQRSREWAEHDQLDAKGVTTYGLRSAFLKPVKGSVASAYRASADELELWTDAKVSPVVFGKRKFARRLSEEELKGAMTFNLRHLLPGMGDLKDALRPEKRRSLAATSERSRKSHVAFIVQEALGLEEQTPVEETDDGFSIDDIPNGLQGSPDTPGEATDADNRDSKVAIRPVYEPNLKRAFYNTHSLSFQRQRRSFLPPNRNTPFSSVVNVQKNIVKEHIPSYPPPKTTSISTPDDIQAAESSAPRSHDSIHSFTLPLKLLGHEHSGYSPKELSREPFQTPKESLLAAKEPGGEVIEVISPMVIVEDPNIARSPSAQSSSPSAHEDTTFTNSHRIHEDLQHFTLQRDGSTPSSLFGTSNAPETTVGSPPPSEVFPPQAIHDVPVPSGSVPSSELDSERYSEGLPATRNGKFFHECSMQSSEDPPYSSAMARGVVFGTSTGSSNMRFRDITTWPSPAAPEDHPYLQEARELMVIVKLREDLLPHFGEADEVDTKENYRDSGIEGESEIDDEDELDGSGDSDAIESNGTHDELDTLTAFPSTPAAAGRHDMALPGWVSYSITPSRRARDLHDHVDGRESISTGGARGTNAEQESMIVPPAATSSAGDEDDQINHEDQLEDWTASLHTLVKGKRVLLPEELLNLKTVLNAVHTHSSTISASSELAQAVLQVAKLETKDIPNQDSLGLRSLARKSLRAWGLSARTNT